MIVNFITEGDMVLVAISNCHTQTLEKRQHSTKLSEVVL